MLTIEQCAKKYNVSSSTLRKWIKRGLLTSTFQGNQWLIDEKSLQDLLKEKGLTIEVNQRLTSDDMVNQMVIQIATLEKENELLREQINFLKEEREFLRGQLQQLTNTISLLTTRQLPEPKGLIDRIKSWFKKE